MRLVSGEIISWKPLWEAAADYLRAEILRTIWRKTEGVNTWANPLSLPGIRRVTWGRDINSLGKKLHSGGDPSTGYLSERRGKIPSTGRPFARFPGLDPIPIGVLPRGHLPPEHRPRLIHRRLGGRGRPRGRVRWVDLFRENRKLIKKYETKCKKKPAYTSEKVFCDDMMHTVSPCKPSREMWSGHWNKTLVCESLNVRERKSGLCTSFQRLEFFAFKSFSSNFSTFVCRTLFSYFWTLLWFAFEMSHVLQGLLDFFPCWG